MTTQTVFKAGNSNVVAISSKLPKELGIKPGIKVVVKKVPNENLIKEKLKKMSKYSTKRQYVEIDEVY